MHKSLFFNKFIIFLYKFQALLWPSSVGSPVRTCAPAECEDTGCCIIQFELLMMSTTVLET